MRVFRKADHRRNPVWDRILGNNQCPAYHWPGINLGEKTLRRIRSQYDLMRLRERLSYITRLQRIAEHTQESIVDKYRILLSILLDTPRDDLPPIRLNPRVIDHLRKIVLHRLADTRIGDRAMLDQLAVLIPVIIDPVQIPDILIELIIAQLEIHILQDQQT